MDTARNLAFAPSAASEAEPRQRGTYRINYEEGTLELTDLLDNKFSVFADGATEVSSQIMLR